MTGITGGVRAIARFAGFECNGDISPVEKARVAKSFILTRCAPACAIFRTGPVSLRPPRRQAPVLDGSNRHLETSSRSNGEKK
jgi:hypothetical protein